MSTSPALPPLVRVRDAHLLVRPMKTRMPFRYGIARVTQLDHSVLQLQVIQGVSAGSYVSSEQTQNREARGLAADHLAPKWFTKNPATSYEEDVAEMLRVHQQAITFALETEEAMSPFALWKRVYEKQSEWGRAKGLAPLLTQFGTSLVERAVIDGFCRMTGRSFAQLLHENAFGIRLGDIHPELAGREPADYLPAAPLPRIIVRHTVGLSDPLTERDIAPGERVKDGLPESLESCIRTYGLRHFKIKVGGDPEGDAARLARVLQTIAENAENTDAAKWAFSLDGNESYKSFADLRAFWNTIQNSSSLSPHLSRLLFIEQPFHRDLALSDTAGVGFADWSGHPPIVIDESDAGLESLPRALLLGYAGTSHKNCKGVFKSVANACLIEHRRRANPRSHLLLTGEDLSNIGPIALQQDLAVQAALGIDSVERNGHHYFAGLSSFPQKVQDIVASYQGDLFRRIPGTFPTLAITDGRISLDTVNAAPFGYQEVPGPENWAEETPAERR